MNTTSIKNETPKTKQEMLDKENPTDKEWAIQQILIANSKTTLSEHRRVMKRLAQALWKTKARQLTMEEVMDAIDIAAKLLETEKPQ